VSTGGLNFDYKKILLALGQNILVIILAALICGGAFFGYTYFFTKPVYSSSVMVYINKSTVSISGAELVLSSGEGYVTTYTTLLSSRTTLEEIAETAGVNYSPEQLRKMISTSATQGTSFLTITVTCGSPTEAELIANTIASVLPNRVSDIVEGSTLRVVDYAVIPSSRSTASLSTNFFIGLVAGAVIVAVIIALSVFIQTNHSPTINSSTDLAQFYPEYPLLGVIRDLSYSDKKYQHSDYGYGKYSDYYSKPNKKAEEKLEKEEKTEGRK